MLRDQQDVRYNILKEPPKAGSSKEPMDNFCKMGRKFILIIIENEIYI